MGDYKIRLAVPGEEAAIHEAHMRSIREICVKKHGAEEVKGWGHRELGTRWVNDVKANNVWVVEIACKIEGVGNFVLREGHAYLQVLYLTPVASGRGIGDELMKILLQKMRDSGVPLIRLNSTLTAFNFYQRHGFKRTGPDQQDMIAGHPVTSIPMELAV